MLISVDMASTMSTVSTAVLGVALLLAYFYRWLYNQRFTRFRGFPQPKSDLLWGHLKVLGEVMNEVKARGKTDGPAKHHDYAMALIHERLGSPGVQLLDMWPIQYTQLQIFSHNVAEQISRPSKGHRYSIEKSPTMHAFDALVGDSSVLVQNNEEWKALRKRFNPGFAPQHIITMLPQVIKMTRRFVEKLNRLSKSGKEFEMNLLATNLTFDIIGAVILDVDFRAQDDDPSVRSPICSSFESTIASWSGPGGSANWRKNSIMKIFGKRRGQDHFNAAVKVVIRESFATLKAEENNDPVAFKKSEKGRSVLALSLLGVDELTPAIEDVTSAQVRTFLFAGHDTTSITLQWALYMLHRYPHVQAALTAELDSVLGHETSPSAVADELLARGEEALSQLTYLSAIIKEVLRLFPPASSARMAPPGSGTMLRLDDGSNVCVDGLVLYVMHFGVHRDPKVYGEDAEVFRPERWLGDTDMSMEKEEDHESHTAANGKTNDHKAANDKQIPPSAWRPFERGPRSCIGQELANLEAKVILATVARGYVFEKVGLGRMVDGEVVGEEMYNKFQITSRPADNMRMKVHSASKV